MPCLLFMGVGKFLRYLIMTSLLLWVFMLTLWMTAVSVFSRHLPQPVVSRILAVMALVTLVRIDAHQLLLRSALACAHRACNQTTA